MKFIAIIKFSFRWYNYIYFIIESKVTIISTSKIITTNYKIRLKLEDVWEILSNYGNITTRGNQDN